MTDYSCGNTANERHRLDVPSYNCAAVHYRSSSDPHTGHKHCASEDHRMIVDANRCSNHLEERRFRVVASRKDRDVTCDGDMLPNLYAVAVVE